MGVQAGRPVLVVGLGVSGRAAARALLAAGADVRVVDGTESAAVTAVAGELDAAGALVRVGVDLDRAGLVDGIDLVVASPGVPPSTGVLQAARARGVDVVSEPELAWRLSGGSVRVLGVTGTNGKTTTTEALARVVGAPAVGNIGTPMIDVLCAPDRPPAVVAELSSFQLHHTRRLRCDVGVLLNVADDHLDWHGDHDAYAAAKARIWARQRPGASPGLAGADWAVVGVDDPGAAATLAAHPPGGRVMEVTAGPPTAGQVGIDAGAVVVHLPEDLREAGAAVGPVEVASVDALGLRGPHNVMNAMAAVAAAVCSGLRPDAVTDPAALAGVLADLRPGAHRLALVAEAAGVRWVDDSKATNPHAAAAALASFDRVVWIAGGLAKGVDMATLDPLIARHVVEAITIGTDGPVIASRARELGVPTVEAGDMARAVQEAARAARSGDVVLLAPACASMDQFRDYADRGEAFARLAREQTGGRS